MFDDLSLTTAICVDVSSIAIALFVIRKIAGSPLHPAWMFLAVHSYIVSFRLLQLARGGTPMRSYFSWPLSMSEVTRASVACDLGLISMMAGWLYVYFHRNKFRLRRIPLSVSNFRLRIAVSVSLGMGAVALVTTGRTAGIDVQSVSGYISSATSWPSWAMCLLAFGYGITIRQLILTAVTLVAVGYFSYERFAVVIPVIFILLVWLSRRHSRRIPLKAIILAIVLAVLWLPLKTEVSLLSAGYDVKYVARVGMEKLSTALAGKDAGMNSDNVDTEFLDMIGSTMTLVDVRGRYFWGSTVTPFFVAMIPRQLWPEKPQHNQYQLDLDIPERKMFGGSAMTSGLVGEAYANFGWAGIPVTCFVTGVFFAALYYAAITQPTRSPIWLFYLIFLSTSMQLCRDGLVSAVWFPFVYAAPITALAISHWLLRPLSRHSVAFRVSPYRHPASAPSTRA